MSVGAVLLDLDGTLVDSAPDLAAAANTLLADHALPALETAEVADMVGDGVAKLVERVLSTRGLAHEPLPAAVARFLAFYERHPVTLSRLYP